MLSPDKKVESAFDVVSDHATSVSAELAGGVASLAGTTGALDTDAAAVDTVAQR